MYISSGEKVVTYEETAESVTAVCEDGEKMQADILAGFDGIHSAVRDKMLAKETEKSTSAWGHGAFISNFLILHLRTRH